MYEYLNKRYALAFFELGASKGKADEYISSLRDVVQLIKSNAELVQVIKHPQVSTSMKKEIFKNILEGKVSNDLVALVLILIDKNRISNIEGILREIEKINLENHGILAANVKTVIPLTDEERNTLISKLEKKYNKKIQINEEIDKSIIGGVCVRVGDDLIDGTLKHKFSQLRKLMLNNQLSALKE